MRIEASRTYLQMTSPGQLRPFQIADEQLRVEIVEACEPALYRHLYSEVGRGYHWVDRLGWADQEIAAHLAQPGLGVWVMWHGRSTAGYFELRTHEDGSTELAYFGLLPEFLGRGFGKHLLSVAVMRAWETGANRVWLHTSTLDHPAALANYLKRGFTPYKTETYCVEI